MENTSTFLTLSPRNASRLCGSYLQSHNNSEINSFDVISDLSPLCLMEMGLDVAIRTYSGTGQ